MFSTSPKLQRHPFRLLPERAAEPFVGSSRAVRELLQSADRLAPTNLPLLIVGESGTGKDVLARRVHARSGRGNGPFVAENCAAIPEALLESEFFGHERGAFTGAERRHEGALARAHGGTLFLDEIGDMPLALQAKLLRALEDGGVRPVGGSATVKVDVRVVCATNQDLAALVEQGKFRQDLYYRLRGALLRIPALRERRADVPELAQHFLTALNAEGAEKRFAGGVLERLEAHPWPGNGRELRNVVRLLFHLAPGDTIGVEDLELARLDEGRARGGGVVSAVVPMAEIERDAIRLALRETRGNRDEAARRLGISRSTIYARIRTYELASEEEPRRRRSSA